MRGVVLLAALLAGGVVAFAADPPEVDGKRSGFVFMSEDARDMQRDDTRNPGMLAVLEGEALWSAPAGPGARSCASCHGDAAVSMKGVAARHPAFHEASSGPVTLEGRIDFCRRTRQEAPAWRFESREMLAITAFVAKQSRGMPITPDPDPRLAPFRERGLAIYTKRQGQLNLACAHCHDDNAGRRLGSAPIPEAHPTGYPIYRLEWQAVGSLQRRLRNCLVGMRAEPFAYGSAEYTALELFLAERAAGLVVETPAVRP